MNRVENKPLSLLKYFGWWGLFFIFVPAFLISGKIPDDGGERIPSSLTWEEVRKGYREPILSSQKPGDLWEVPCQIIRPDEFHRALDLVELTKLNSQSRCGYVTVFQDPDRPDLNRLAHLFFIRFPAQNSVRSEPLIFLTGGPGQPATYLRKGLEEEIRQYYNEQDYLLIDYRGTGMSIPSLNCIGFDGPYSSEDDYLNGVAACRNEILRRGGDPALFTTSHITADIRSVLTALGYQRADFHGVSYGSRVGLTLLRESPEWVRSMVLDSVIPLEEETWTSSDEMIFNPLDEMIDICSRSEGCRPNELQDSLIVLIDRMMSLTEKQPGLSPAEVMGALRTLSREFGLKEWPIKLNSLNRLNDHDLITYLLTRPNDSSISLPALPAEKILSYFGDQLNPIPLLALAILTDFRGLWYSVTCQEEHLSPDQPYPSKYFSADRVKTVAGKIDRFFQERGEKTCRSWGLPISKNKQTDFELKSDVPTLLLSSAIDFNTPLIWAKQIKKNLTNSYHYVSEVGGHDTAGSDPCARSLMLTFLKNPSGFADNFSETPNQAFPCFTRLRYRME